MAGSFQSSPGELCLGHQLLGDTSQLQQGLLGLLCVSQVLFPLLMPLPCPMSLSAINSITSLLSSAIFHYFLLSLPIPTLSILGSTVVLQHRKENHQYLPKDQFSNRVLQRGFRGSSNVM